ncbi:MAG TPA: glycosyltransferase [Rhizomicrobium sp.]|jgi:glycosyltransferase involved in cell wall biosynthesis|nr:glycosyltransferase [Rhizomicrobium sp.]
MIYLYSPDDNQPNGGIRTLYRHADVLNRHGFAAAIVHLAPGFRCSWFENQAPVVYARTVRPENPDFMVVPEIYGPDVARTAPGIRKVIFNQNCYNSFRHYPIDTAPGETPYLHPDIIATITVSEDSARYLAHAFPQARILRIRPGIDATLFHPGTPKRRQIAFMPRRQIEDARQVFNILKFRGALESFDIVEIRDLAHHDAARILRESAFFFSFSGIEGFGLPPAEAMAAGCITIGYHGRGGAEFFRPEFSWPIAFGDIESYAQTAEAVLNRYRRDSALLVEKAQTASAFIARNYSVEIEEADIVDCWRQIAGPA